MFRIVWAISSHPSPLCFLGDIGLICMISMWAEPLRDYQYIFAHILVKMQAGVRGLVEEKKWKAGKWRVLSVVGGEIKGGRTSKRCDRTSA